MNNVSFPSFGGGFPVDYSRTNSVGRPSALQIAKQLLNEFGTSVQSNDSDNVSSSSSASQPVLTKETFLNALNQFPKPKAFQNANGSALRPNAEQIYNFANSNGDDRIDEAELTAMIEKVQSQMQNQGVKDSRQAPPDPTTLVTAEGLTRDELRSNIIEKMQGSGVDSNMSSQMADQLVERLFGGDSDNNGKLTTAEVQAKKDQMQASQNGGGFVMPQAPTLDTSNLFNS
jgi:hypothetical protein